MSKNDSVGGCLFVSLASVEMRSLFFLNCSAANGAGVGVARSAVKIYDTIFSQNGLASIDTALLLQGAGSYFEESLVEVSSCSFYSNFFSGAIGIGRGAAAAFVRSNVSLAGNSIVGGCSISILVPAASEIQGGGFLSHLSFSHLIQAHFTFLAVLS